MKHGKKSLALLCAAALLCAGLAGCGKGQGETSPTPPAAEGDRAAKIAAEPQTVSLLIPGYTGKDEDSYYTRAIQKFEEQYGKKVEVLQAVGEQLWNEKVAAQIAAKDPVDVFYISVDQYLGMYLKGYLTPVNDYVDLEKPGHKLKVMDDYVKFEDQYYAAGVSATPYVLFYNRSILENNGFDPDEPQKLYEAGEWTWDAFREIARECTDKDTGVVGIENMFDEVFQASNCCAAVDYRDGAYQLNIGSANMRQTLEFCQDIFNKNPICGNGYVTGQNRFLKGNAAMHGAYAYELATFNSLVEAGSVKIDFGVTAFPAGPNNAEGKSFGHSTGYAISTGSDAPYSAGMLIDMILDEAALDNAEKQAHVPQEAQALFDSLSENLFVPSYTDGILEKGFGAFYLLYDVRNGEDINQMLAQYETTYQKMIDDANILLK